MNTRLSHRVPLVFAAILLACCLTASRSMAQSNRPNILLLFSDDQRADTIAAWGNTHIRTPNIDHLVDRGFSFQRNYCFGSWHGAVCVPSRAMLHTGRHLFAVDSQMTGAVTLGQLLRRNGYTTFGTGKWHNGHESFIRSFEFGRAIMFGGMSNHIKVPLNDLSADGKVVNKRTGDKFSSELFADAAIEFLQSRDGNKPFFCYVAFTDPHDPRQAPLPYRQRYYQNLPPLPANFLPQHPFDTGQMTVRDENLAAWPRDPDVIRQLLAEYYGQITYLDDQIGRILSTLHNTPGGDNTIIIYASDHGLAMGSHGLLGKQSIYEHSMRCPLIFIAPGIPAGRSSHALTYLYDIYPTLCDMLGITPPDGLAGKSLRPIWNGETPGVRDTLFLAYGKLMRSVRDDRWKLIRWPQINHVQLFDLQDDPNEMINLAGNPRYAARVARMTGLMGRWQERVGDDQPLTVEDPKPMAIDLTGHPRKPDKWQPQWIVEKYFSN